MADASAANPPVPAAATVGTVPPRDSAAVASELLAAEPIVPADAGDGNAEADEFDPLDLDDQSASTSLKTSLMQHHYENGRRYHQYRTGRYPIPNDDVEQNRDDMKHVMMLELTDGALFFAPIGPSPHRILDLGTGTGIWAMDVADKFPSAEILGVDLSPIQPSWVPPNVRFLVDDVEDEWLNGGDWDFIHLRCLVPWLKNTPKVLQTVFDNLKPGGWIEVQEFDGRVNCDDYTVADDSPLKRFFDLIPKAMANFGMTFNGAERLRKPLEDAGFVNINLKILKVPYGTWAQDSRLRLIGKYCEITIGDLLDAMAAKPFKMLKELNDVEIELLKTGAKKQMKDPKSHAYVKYLFWTAQKPE